MSGDHHEQDRFIAGDEAALVAGADGSYRLHVPTAFGGYSVCRAHQLVVALAHLIENPDFVDFILYGLCGRDDDEPLN